MKVRVAWNFGVVAEETYEDRKPKQIESQLRPFYSHVKKLTLVGYYTWEIVATKELQYKHIRGRYDGSMPIEELGRVWVLRCAT